MDYILQTAQLKKEVIRQRPLIHHITNFVTTYQCARITAILGASPVMAFAAEETAEVAQKADALVINTGTLNNIFTASIPKAVEAAQKRQIPVVLDPVGINLSEYRRNFIRFLLKNYRFTVIRCNYVELFNLHGEFISGSGIDGERSNSLEEASSAAAELARMYHCTVACTGQTDIIADKERFIQLNRGSALLPKLVGTGCMVNSLIGSFAPVSPTPFDAAISGILTMCLAGEAAQKALENPDHLGSFETLLLDHIRDVHGFEHIL